VGLSPPLPRVGLRYNYLCTAEHTRGQEQGPKDRPCAVVLVSDALDGSHTVIVLPVTHTLQHAVHVPGAVKRPGP
jgi:hypothetical protein